jgi:phospholipase C
VTPGIVGTYGMVPRPGTTHAVGLPRNAPDQRFPELLPNGPFQIAKHVGYEEPVGDPLHRFFQMSQQVDGGRRDLFVWVAETSGESSQNRADPAVGGDRLLRDCIFYARSQVEKPLLH